MLPTYNRGYMISHAIESVINQTFTNWELVIVDDGSTDKTRELVNRYIKNEKRIKYFFQENTERSAARNNGISKAKGDWVCFLDSDDLYHKNHLDEFDKLIKSKNSNPGLYFSGVSLGKFQEDQQFYNLSGKNNLEFVLLNTIGVPRACCNVDILLENPFNPNIRIGEDKELWSRIATRHPVYFHKKKTFIEIEHKQRSINIIDKKEELNTLKIICSRNIIRPKILHKLFSDIYFTISKSEIRKKRKILAINNLLLSVYYKPLQQQTIHKILLILSIMRLYKPLHRNYQ